MATAAYPPPLSLEQSSAPQRGRMKTMMSSSVATERIEIPIAAFCYGRVDIFWFFRGRTHISFRFSRPTNSDFFLTVCVFVSCVRCCVRASVMFWKRIRSVGFGSVLIPPNSRPLICLSTLLSVRTLPAAGYVRNCTQDPSATHEAKHGSPSKNARYARSLPQETNL